MHLPTTILATFLAIYSLNPHSHVLAHIPYFEQQLFDASPQSDWTMESPFIIPLDPTAGFSPSLNTSRAITSVLGLTPEDTYDVAMFEIAENSPSSPPQQVIIGLEALAPNCPENAPLSSANFYPSLALLGPSSDPQFSAKLDASTMESLPFPFPKDGEYGAIIRNQPRVPQAQRGVYSAGPFNSYLLPFPVTPECITTEQGFSTCANGTAAQTSFITDLKLTTPGKYYIVWWDPDQEESSSGGVGVPSIENPILYSTDTSNNSGGSSGDGSVTVPEEVLPPSGGMTRPGLPRQVTISLGVSEEISEREQGIQMEVMTGQKVPAFNPCTGAFVAPVLFVEGMPPSME